jgi:hypothetical protein
MANYQPRVGLTWKYLQNANEANHDPNLKIVCTIHVEVAQNELIAVSRASLRDTVIVLNTGGGKTGNFTEEWFAPFNVEYGLPENDANKEILMSQIDVNGPVKVTTTFKKTGKVEGETINHTTQNANIEWS